MVKWADVITDERYQRLSEDKKIDAKAKFFKKVIEPSAKFQSMDAERKKAFVTEFSRLKEKEGFGRFDFATKPSETTVFLDPKIALAQSLIKPSLEVVKAGDRFIDKLADKIEGKVKPSAKGGSLELKDIPKATIFFAAEAARLAKPSNLIVAKGAGVGLKVLGPPVGRAIASKTPAFIKEPLTRFFTTGKGAPGEFLSLKEAAKQEALAGAREAEAVGNKLFFAQKNMKIKLPGGGTKTIRKGQPLPESTQNFIGRIFRGEFNQVKNVQGHPKFKELKVIADEARVIQDKWSKALIESGIPKKQAQKTIEENIGTYMARFFKAKIKKDGADGVFSMKWLRIRMPGLKRRQELSEEVLRAMGEIKAPALPVSTRIKQTSSAIANNKLFSKVASNPEWTATTDATGKMIQMADTPALGALRGKWVIKSIGEQINAIVPRVGGGSAALDVGAKLYVAGLQGFKFGKVVLNPATHARNMITNTMLLDMSGVNHFRQAFLFPKVMADYIKKGPIYQSALREGAIGGEFVGGDIRAIQKWYLSTEGHNLSKWSKVFKMPANLFNVGREGIRKAGDIYRGEEQLAKLVKFADMLDRGATPAKAAKEAQKWLFDYTDIPDAVKVAKQIAPFFTFTYKSIPRVVETMANNPLKIYKYYAMFQGANEASRKILKLSPAEFAREQNALPPWLIKEIGGMPAVLMAPYRDKRGRTRWLNLEYILPLGQAPDILNEGIKQGNISGTVQAIVGNPFANTYSALASNKDFRGKDIIAKGSTHEEASKAAISYLYKQWAPSLAPGIFDIKGGYSFEKLMRAINKTPEKYDANLVERELTPTLFDIFLGLKTTPVDVDRADFFSMLEKKKALDALRSQYWRIGSDQSMPEEERFKKMEGIFKKMEDVLK